MSNMRRFRRSQGRRSFYAAREKAVEPMVDVSFRQPGVKPGGGALLSSIGRRGAANHEAQTHRPYLR